MFGTFPLLNVIYNCCFKKKKCKDGFHSEQMDTVNILVIS